MPDRNPIDPRNDFAGFYVRYSGFVAAVLKEKYYHGDVADGVQDTMERFWRHRERYTPGGKQGWLPVLAMVASRLCIDEFRRARRRDVSLDPYAHDRADDDPYVSPETRAIQAERSRLLDKLLAATALTAREREAIEARRRQAGWRGTPTGATRLERYRVYNAIDRAVEKLRRTAATLPTEAKTALTL